MTKEIFKTNNKGITLIALIITIIVMLILVGVTVNIALNGGLFGIAEDAAKGTKYEQDREILQAGVLGAINTETLEIPSEQELKKNLPEGWEVFEVVGTDTYTATSPNNNVFTVDIKGNIAEKGENPEPSTGDLAVLEKYLLGEDGKGKDLSKIVVSIDGSNIEFKDDPDTPEDETEIASKIHIYDGIQISNELNEDEKGIFYITKFCMEYNKKIYVIAMRMNDPESGLPLLLTKTLEYRFTPSGREGEKIDFDTNGDGRISEEEKNWTILYDYGNGIVEAVAPDVVGERLELGSTDKTAQIPGDVDKDGTSNTNLDKAIYSYNNAVKTINDYCKEQIKNTNISKENIRSVGSNPSNPYAENYTLYESENLKNWNKKYNKLLKSPDENYEQDIIRMICFGGTRINTHMDYWVASRGSYKEQDKEAVGIRKFWYTGNNFETERLIEVFTDGKVESYNGACGVHPIIKISSNT